MRFNFVVWEWTDLVYYCCHSNVEQIRVFWNCMCFTVMKCDRKCFSVHWDSSTSQRFLQNYYHQHPIENMGCKSNCHHKAVWLKQLTVPLSISFCWSWHMFISNCVIRKDKSRNEIYWKLSQEVIRKRNAMKYFLECDAHWTGRWVGPWAGLDRVAKRKKSHHWLRWEMNRGRSARSGGNDGIFFSSPHRPKRGPPSLLSKG